MPLFAKYSEKKFSFWSEPKRAFPECKALNTETTSCFDISVSFLYTYIQALVNKYKKLAGRWLTVLCAHILLVSVRT